MYIQPQMVAFVELLTAKGFVPNGDLYSAVIPNIAPAGMFSDGYRKVNIQVMAGMCTAVRRDGWGEIMKVTFITPQKTAEENFEEVMIDRVK